MTTSERVHRFVDDEPLRAEEEAALAEAAANRAAGVPLIPMEEFLSLAESVHAGSGGGGRSWTRDELYER
jgi:hypothetical protein